MNVFSVIWNDVFSWFDSILSVFSSLSSFLSRNLGEVLLEFADLYLIENTPIWLIMNGLSVTPLAYWSVVNLIFGAGLPLCLIVAVIKFFKDLIF